MNGRIRFLIGSAAIVLGASGAWAAEGAKLDQEQAVGAAMAYNLGQVAVGTTILARTTDPELRGYAQRLVDEHAAANNALLGAMRAANAYPKDSPLREKMNANAQKELSILWTEAPGTKLDQRFLSDLIAGQQATLSDFDTMILPAVRVDGVRQALSNLRASEAGHLEVACTIGTRVGANTKGCPPASPGTK